MTHGRPYDPGNGSCLSPFWTQDADFQGLEGV